MSNEHSGKLTRREFLKIAGVGAAGAVLSACGLDATPTPTATPTRVKTTPTVTPAEATAIPTRQEITKTPVPPTPEIKVTPTPSPTEKVTTIMTGEVEILKKTDKEIVFNPKLLELARKQVLDSGLVGKIKAIVIVDPNDPILNTEEYPGDKTLLKPQAVTTASKNPEEGVTIYLANTQLSESDIIHEIGHAADPLENKSVQFDIKEFDDDYWFNHFYPNYLLRLPPSIKGNELLPLYLFPYEKNIIEGACHDIGEKAWEKFFSAFGSLPFGSSQFFIPDGELQTLSSSLPENSLQKQAVEWRMKEIDRLKSEGKTPEIKGFTYDCWGRYLMRIYFEHPDVVQQNFPELFEDIKRIAIQGYSLARIEVWADLWVERVRNPDSARRLYPLGVQTQERVIEFLKGE